MKILLFFFARMQSPVFNEFEGFFPGLFGFGISNPREIEGKIKISVQPRCSLTHSHSLSPTFSHPT